MRIFDSSMTPANYRVLLVDDDPAMLRILSKWLAKAGYPVRTAVDGQEALEAIELECPDFLVTDWEMPRLDGLELCRRVREMLLPHYVYIIFLTVRTGAKEMIAGLENGADDFLTKPVTEGELLARMRSSLRVLELERRLSVMAHTDSLTGLLTQRSFYESLEKEWHRAKRFHLPLSCVMMDLDFFKQVNDVHGHQAGDSVLKFVAELLVDNCRASDTVCRYGGEEFCTMSAGDQRERGGGLGGTRPNAAGLAVHSRRPQKSADQRQLRRGPVPRRHAELRGTGRSGRPGPALRQASGPRPHHPLRQAGRRRGAEPETGRPARRGLRGRAGPRRHESLGRVPAGDQHDRRGRAVLPSVGHFFHAGAGRRRRAGRLPFRERPDGRDDLAGVLAASAEQRHAAERHLVRGRHADPGNFRVPLPRLDPRRGDYPPGRAVGTISRSSLFHWFRDWVVSRNLVSSPAAPCPLPEDSTAGMASVPGPRSPDNALASPSEG